VRRNWGFASVARQLEQIVEFRYSGEKLLDIFAVKRFESCGLLSSVFGGLGTVMLAPPSTSELLNCRRQNTGA
jgi:hypothetical protein